MKRQTSERSNFSELFRSGIRGTAGYKEAKHCGQHNRGAVGKKFCSLISELCTSKVCFKKLDWVSSLGLPINEKRRFPSEEYYNIKQFHPVFTQSIGRYVRSKINMTP